MGSAEKMPNVSVWGSADCDSPNFLIKMWCADWMNIGHVRRRVNEVLSMADSWDGDGEFCVALAPVWGDGWDGDCDDQALVAITEGCDMGFWGEFGWEESDEVVVIEMYDEFDPYC